MIIIAGVSVNGFLRPEPGARCHSLTVSHPDRRLVGFFSLVRRESDVRLRGLAPEITEHSFGRKGGGRITYERKQEEIRAPWGWWSSG